MAKNNNTANTNTQEVQTVQVEMVMLSSSTPTNIKMVPKGQEMVITCCDCGATRVINKADAFQVVRCVACQEALRKARRSAKGKEKRAAASAVKNVQALKDTLGSNPDEIMENLKKLGII